MSRQKAPERSPCSPFGHESKLNTAILPTLIEILFGPCGRLLERLPSQVRVEGSADHDLPCKDSVDGVPWLGRSKTGRENPPCVQLRYAVMHRDTHPIGSTVDQGPIVTGHPPVVRAQAGMQIQDRTVEGREGLLSDQTRTVDQRKSRPGFRSGRQDRWIVD